MSRQSHPAIERIRSAIQGISFSSGTVKVPVEFCELYYKPDPAKRNAETLNLADATDEQLNRLISVCEAAPFGRGTESVMDESYRKALKLELSQFSTPFDLAATGILYRIQQDLVDTYSTLRRMIRAEPYKLNVYNKGAFFKQHKDTPRAENMFGSLVLVFPTAHEGGNLILTQNGQGWTFDAPRLLTGSTPMSPEVAYIAFYSDTTHEVKPVTSGARVTLTYNLYFDNFGTNLQSDVPDLSIAKYSAVKEALKELLDDSNTFGKPYEKTRLCFGLSHGYPVSRGGESSATYKVSELSKYLKGSDAVLYRVCKDLGLDTDLRVLYRDEKDPDYPKSFFGEDFFEDFKDPDSERGIEDQCTDMEKFTSRTSNRLLLWVTNCTGLTGAVSHYIAYGNEPSNAKTYGEVCIFARRPPQEVASDEEDMYY